MLLRRHFTLWILGFLALLAPFFYTPSSFAITGDGSPETPYTLASCADLLLLDGVTYTTTSHYEMTGDIDCTGETDVFPLFDVSNFSGNFEGNNFTISGLAESHNTVYTAMFAGASNATIQNFTLEGSIVSTETNVAGLVAEDQGGNVFTNIHVHLDITGKSYMIGGIVANSLTPVGAASTYTNVNYEGTISTSDAASPSQNVGGFGGYMDSGIVSNSSVHVTFVFAEHSGIVDIGGFAGHADDVEAENLNVTSEILLDYGISSVTNTGGFVGLADDSLFNNNTVVFTFTAGDNHTLRGEDFYNIGGFAGISEIGSSMNNNLVTATISLYGLNASMIGGFSGNVCASNDPELDCLHSLDNNSVSGTITLDALDDLYNVGGFAGTADYVNLSNILVDMDINAISENVSMLGGLVGNLNNSTLNSNYYTGFINIDAPASPGSNVYNIGGIVGHAEADEMFALIPVNEMVSNMASGVIEIGSPSTKIANLSFVGGVLGGGSGGSYTDSYSNMVISLYSNDNAYNIGGFLGAIDAEDMDIILERNAFYGEVILANDEALNPQFIAGFAGGINKTFGSANLSFVDNFASGIIFAPSSVAGFVGVIDGNYGTTEVARLYTDVELTAFNGEDYSGFINSLGGVFALEDIIVATKFTNDDIASAGVVLYNNDDTDMINVYYNDTSMQDTQCGDEFTLDEDSTSCIAYNLDGDEDALFVNTSTQSPLDNWDFDIIWQVSSDTMPMLRAHGDIFDTDIDDPSNLGFDFDEGITLNMEEPVQFSFDIDHLNRFKNFYYTISFHLGDPEEPASLVYNSNAVQAGSHTYTFGDDTGEYLVSTPDTLEDGDYYVSLYLIDEFDNESNVILFGEEDGFLLWLDRTGPVLTEETAIDESIYENTAIYTFHMDDGEELYIDDCGPTISATMLAPDSSVSVTFADLVLGESYTCDMYVVDEAGNLSNTLTAGPFTYTTAPRSGGGGGGGGKARPSSSRTNENTPMITEPLVLENEISYEDEVAQAFALGVLTKEGTKEANKCEALMMMSRVLKWNLVSTEEAPFSDVPEWCYDIAAYAKANGITQGRSEGILGLDSPLSRYEFVTMFVRAIEKDIQDIMSLDMENSFSDTLVNWADRYVRIAHALELVKGFEDGTFGGEKSIHKQDLAIMLLRFKDL